MQELKGIPVVKSLTEKLKSDIKTLEAAGIAPRLAIVRVGECEDDLAYENSILRKPFMH